jgi:hypothetical protein
VTEQPDLEARVAQLEAQLDALTAAVKNVPTGGVSDEQLRAALLAALERQEVPGLDATGEPLRAGRKYAHLGEWPAIAPVDKYVPIYSASHAAVVRDPGMFVSVQTPRPAVRRLRAERGLA